MRADGVVMRRRPSGLSGELGNLTGTPPHEAVDRVGDGALPPAFSAESQGFGCQNHALFDVHQTVERQGAGGVGIACRAPVIWSR